MSRALGTLNTGRGGGEFCLHLVLDQPSDASSCSANPEPHSPLSSVTILNNVHPVFRLWAWPDAGAPEPCWLGWAELGATSGEPATDA